MGFWIFMLVMELLIPLSMIGFGRKFSKAAPKSINWAYGYRTSMSMKNEDTWIFAHLHFGKIWYRAGWVTLVVTVIVMLCLLGKDEDMVGSLGGVLCMVQMIPLLVPIFFTESALRKTFDKNGNRKG